MRKLFIAVLILGTSLSLMGFRGAGWRAARTVAGDWTFSESLDADSLNTDHLVVNTSAYLTGVVRTDKSVWLLGDTLFFTDGGADTNVIVNTGSYLEFGGDNPMWLHGLTYSVNIYSITDSASLVGAATNRYKEIHAIRHISTLPDKSDSAVFDAKGITGTAYIRGTATFDATKTADTLLITGGTASDFYWIQVKGSTVPTSPFTCAAKVGSLIVNCAVGDTAVARAGGYNWLRMQ